MATERLQIQINEKGARVVSRQIKDVGKASLGAEGSVQLLRRALGLLSIALLLVPTIKLLAKFSQEMSTVRAITKATEGQFNELRDSAKRLGATTRFSATQAAEGMVFLGRAGFDTNEILQTIEGTLQLAQAGALDLASAADIASNVLQGFRLETDQTGRVVDVLALAANSTNTNVLQLGDAMKLVAPIAAGLGVSMETTAAAIGALSNAGLQATLAGTGLRQVLGELEAPTTKTRKLFKQLGIGAEEVRVSEVGLTQALIRLKAAGIDTGLALQIFGKRGGPAFEVLSNSIPDVIELNEALDNATGTAKRIANVMDENLNGALFALRSAAEAVLIEFGDFEATGALTGLFRRLASALRFVAANMDTFGRIVNTVAIVLGVIFARKAIGAAIAGIRALSVAILANPFGAIAVAITTVIALLVSFGDRIAVSGDGVVKLGDIFEAAFETISRVTRQTLTGITFLLNSLVGDADNTAKQVVGSFDFILLGAARAIDKVVDNFQIGLLAIKTAFNFLPEIFGVIAIRAGNKLIEGFEAGVNGAIKLVNQLPGLEIAPVTLTRIKDNFELAGSDFGKALQKGLAARTQFTVLEDSAKNLLLRAREIAEANRPDPTTEPVLGTGGKTAIAEGVKIDTELQKRLGLLKLIKEQLADEARLLGFSNRERVIQADLLRLRLKFEKQNLQLLPEEEKQIELILRQNQALDDQAQLFEELTGRVDEARAQISALNILFDAGKISVEQFNQKLLELRLQSLEGAEGFGAGVERAFIRFQDSIKTTAELAEDAFTLAFNGASEALSNFIETGTFEINGFFRNIASLLIKNASKQLVAGAVGQISGGIGSILGSLGGGGGGGGFGSILSSIAGSFFGAQNGADFTVNSSTAAANLGASGGVDNRLVAFRARDGENVTVTPEGQSGRRPVMINFNITTPDADSFRRSEGQFLSRTIAALNRANTRDN